MKMRENIYTGGKPAEEGFTLVEIVVAIAFFSVIAVAVGQSLVTGQKSSVELRRDSAVVAACEELMRDMSIMSKTDLINQHGNTFMVTGVPGSGSIEITNPYLGSDSIVGVVLRWNGARVMESAFGDPAVTGR
jgi:prepilin-type N-terminal cleavage/methylation domain-containing protein